LKHETVWEPPFDLLVDLSIDWQVVMYHTFVGGGSGFVGRYMQKCFRRKGYNVKLISRNPQKDALTWVR